ncbi:ATP-dependent helicase [Williamsia sterculiae]|uniref:DNA 3'-5' helicase n=1 Tax=Williamsia sterculiae TaxID=1344003 RepID=A0A1N7FY06_9NOCA|nr:ATP-dependent DNA helicase [Williamsia sterculiae]SIS05263.1 Superfamily I DNA or RNA helicase [Williamsia sterculiae]
MSMRGHTRPRGAEVHIELVSAPVTDPVRRRWTGPAADLITGPVTARRPESAPGWDPVVVHGGPGTGKTSLLVDVAIARLTEPSVDPESVLVLAGSRRAAVELREQITAGVLRGGGARGSRATREPVVRTVHSYAFSVLRLQAAALDLPAPRLITGSEQDAVLRELLAGDLADGATRWPPRLRPALATAGFAQALRDLMLRAAERGVGPDDLVELGRAHEREEWVAAGRAYRQYEETTLLRAAVGVDSPQTAAVDAAELIGAAMGALATDDVLLRRERGRVRHLLVDDAQHLDPQAAGLIRLIGTGADTAVVAADTDQSVYGFRGASPAFVTDLLDDGRRAVVLDTSFRSSPEVLAVGAAVARRLPGARPHPWPVVARDSDAGTATVAVYSSTAKEATAVADLMRRAHLFDGVPWSRMAVVVRSVPRAAPALRRAMRSAGVPVVVPTTEIPLARQRAVAALLLSLRAVEHRLDPDEVTQLLAGPIGGADPTVLRRLRRGLRRAVTAGGRDDQRTSAELIVDVIARAADRPDEPDPVLTALTPAERGPIDRVVGVVRAAATGRTARRGVEEVLWEAWNATRLGPRWSATALRGGPGADQADRDLDAVVALFDAAADFTDSLPAATLGGFVDHIHRLQITGESRSRHADLEAVTIVSAHAAAGREWDVVAVAGVLDGLWPSLRSRGSILGTPALIDLLDGIASDAVDTLSRNAVALADERRLLLVACTRARRSLAVTAVDDGGGDAAPSRFVGELVAALRGTGTDLDADVLTDDEHESVELPVDPGVRRVLSLPSLVAALRSAVCTDPDSDRRRAAAAELARLADAGVPGAHPRDWYGLADPSTDVPLWVPENGPVVLSPSNVEALQRCSLRWMLERHGGRDGDAAPAITGTLVHTLVQAVAGEIPPDEVTAALREVWDRVDTGAAWFSAHELARTETMLVNFQNWLRLSRDDLDEVGVEVDVDAILPAVDADPAARSDAVPAQSDPEVRLRGRIDRLERDRDGRLVVVDVKTAKTTISAADGAEHPQLATYQLALELGGVAGQQAVPGGGQLVYVNNSNQKTGAAVREQPALTPELVDVWRQLVRGAARGTVGPVYHATPNPGCGHCPLHTSCPAKLPGKSVIDD